MEKIKKKLRLFWFFLIIYFKTSSLFALEPVFYFDNLNKFSILKEDKNYEMFIVHENYNIVQKYSEKYYPEIVNYQKRQFYHIKIKDIKRGEDLIVVSQSINELPKKIYFYDYRKKITFGNQIILNSKNELIELFADKQMQNKITYYEAESTIKKNFKKKENLKNSSTISNSLNLDEEFIFRMQGLDADLLIPVLYNHETQSYDKKIFYTINQKNKSLHDFNKFHSFFRFKGLCNFGENIFKIKIQQKILVLCNLKEIIEYPVSLNQIEIIKNLTDFDGILSNHFIKVNFIYNSEIKKNEIIFLKLNEEINLKNKDLEKVEIEYIFNDSKFSYDNLYPEDLIGLLIYKNSNDFDNLFSALDSKYFEKKNNNKSNHLRTVIELNGQDLITYYRHLVNSNIMLDDFQIYFAQSD
jgi:hypothetical protein